MKGLALKFQAGMTALIAGMLLLLWLFQIVSLQTFYTDSLMSHIKTEAYQLTKDLERNKGNEFISRASSLAYTKGLAIQLYFDTSLCPYNTESPEPQPSSLSSDPIFTKVLTSALAGVESYETTIHPKYNSKFLISGMPVRAYDGSYHALMISVSLAPLSTTIGILQSQLIVITVILLILALIISFIISRTLTKPILKIEKATRKIAEGDYSVQLDINSGDEIGSLASSVNELAVELSKTDTLRKDLIANVSHDLRTPLSLIRGYAETIMDVTGDNKEKRERQLAIIIDETERLSRIVSDMLDLSRFESNVLEISAFPFDVKGCFTEILSRYEDMGAKSDISTILECDDGIFALGDTQRLSQVFYNLINNAFNHTKSGGKITLSATRENGFIRFSVNDTGSGIPKEELPSIFNRYYKGKATERKIVGTGLGLAIVKNILEAHHAVYGVDSTIGVGTTFWFNLPECAPPAKPDHSFND